MKLKKQISYLGKNLKFLRERDEKTQTEIATALKITRAKVNAFENEVNNNPTVEDLFKFTDYFKISADSLLWLNLKKIPKAQLENITVNGEYISGTKIRILATTVDNNSKENIEIVPIKAKAGYMVGYSDPEFIDKLPSFQLPVLTSHRKYRMFQIEGDSMLPIPDKSFIISEYVEDWNDIKDGQTYVILTQDDGIVFKRIINRIKSESSIILQSMNPNYKDYTVKIEEVIEVWKFVSFISNQISEGMTLESLGAMVSDVRSEVMKLKRAV